MARKINDEAEARRCLEAAERAGSTPAAWARERGIDGRSLHAWQLNFARGARAKSRGQGPNSEVATRALIELVPVSSPPVRAASSGGRYVLEVSGARVEFGDDCSAATLRRVVEALRSC
jgi:hypothetical protein